MKVLFTGRGSSGSWNIRGEQLGEAIGAAVKTRATVEDCRAADVVVAVKRVGPELLKALRDSGRPWAFDVLDFYPQPACTDWTRTESIRWVQAQLLSHQPTAVIWPNQKMREDCDIGLPGMVLRHHHRPGIELNTIRKDVRTVAYEGAAPYLGKWRVVLEEECRRRGWQFTVNPPRLADADLVVALRSGQYAGYAQVNWKSNVKLANAHGSGTPFVGQPECGYVETATGAEYWACSLGDLRACFDWLVPQSTREQVRDRFLSSAYTVEKAGADLWTFLHGL